MSIRDNLTDAHKQKTRVQIEAPDSTLPVRTCDCQNVMTTITSNTEKGSSESARARLNSDRRIRNWLIRIDRPRAQGRHPSPDAGTGTRAFNAPAVFSPNPTVTGSVIGSKHSSNRAFCSLVHRMSRSMAGRSKTDGTSCHDPSRDAQSQRSNQQGFARHRTLERTCSFPKKSQAVKDSTTTTLPRLQPQRTGVPTVSQSRMARRSRIQWNA